MWRNRNRRCNQVAEVGLTLLLSVSALAGSPTEQDRGANVASASPKQTLPGASDETKWKLKQPAPAVECALTLLGDADVEPTKARAKLTVLTDDVTPYLRDQIINRPVWQVTIDDWSVKLPCFREGVKDPFTRTLDMYLDPVDGKLLKLETRWPVGERRLIGPRPSAEEAVRQMKFLSNEIYHGFPSEPPAASFLEAMDDAVRRGGANPLVARQIFGEYVIQSHGRHEPTPVWVITLWGIPPYHLAGPADSNEPNSVLRYIVDAQTGLFRTRVNAPQSGEPPAETKGE
jgi:hypothetical protein